MSESCSTLPTEQIRKFTFGNMITIFTSMMITFGCYFNNFNTFIVNYSDLRFA